MQPYVIGGIFGLIVGFAIAAFAFRWALNGSKTDEKPKYHDNEIIDDAIRTDEAHSAGAFRRIT